MANNKTDYYKVLMHKMNEAHDHKFYLESSWFAYSILEDRLVSALRQSGGITYANNREIRMLGNKMKVINERKTTDKLLAAYFDDELMDEIDTWKNERNDLMHALADGTQTIEAILSSAQNQSKKAKTIVKKACTAARLLKRNRAKVPA